MARTTTIEQILGEFCNHKKRFMRTGEPDYVACVECTGFYSYSRTIGCSNYTIVTKKKILERMRKVIQRYNDMHVGEVQRHD